MRQLAIISINSQSLCEPYFACFMYKYYINNIEVNKLAKKQPSGRFFDALLMVNCELLISLSLEVQNRIAEYRLRLDRKRGEWLKDNIQHGGAAKTGYKLEPVTRLKDIGITKTESHRLQQIADIPEEAFEKHIAEVAENTEGSWFFCRKMLKAPSFRTQWAAVQDCSNQFVNNRGGGNEAF